MDIVFLLERLDGSNLVQPEFIWASDLVWYSDVGFWVISLSLVILCLLSLAPLSWGWCARHLTLSKILSLVLGSSAQKKTMGKYPQIQNFVH